MAISVSNEVEHLYEIISLIESAKIQVLVKGDQVFKSENDLLDEKLLKLLPHWSPSLKREDLEDKGKAIQLLHQIQILCEMALRKLNRYDIHYYISTTKFFRDSFQSELFLFYNLFPWKDEHIHMIRELFNLSIEKGLLTIEHQKMIFKKKITQQGAGYYLSKLKEYFPEKFFLKRFTVLYVWFEDKKMPYESLKKGQPSNDKEELIDHIFREAAKKLPKDNAERDFKL